MKNNLSIIIPHYNSPMDLRRLLLSIGYYEDVQVIVIDDNSTKFLDEYLKCIEDFSPYVIFLRNETGENSAGTCRNYGLKAATGDWLLFADADDLFLPDWYDAIRCEFNAQEDIIYYRPTSLNVKTNQMGKRHKFYEKIVEAYDPQDLNSILNLRYFHVVPWSKMIRKNVVDMNNIKFDSTRYANDEMFSAKVGFYAKNITVNEKCFYCVTETEGSLTTNLNADSYWIRTNVFVRKYIFMREHLSSLEWKSSEIHKEPLRRLREVICRKYGLRVFVKYVKLFHENNIKIFSADLLVFLTHRFIMRQKTYY